MLQGLPYNPPTYQGLINLSYTPPCAYFNKVGRTIETTCPSEIPSSISSSTTTDNKYQWFNVELQLSLHATCMPRWLRSCMIARQVWACLGTCAQLHQMISHKWQGSVQRK